MFVVDATESLSNSLRRTQIWRLLDAGRPKNFDIHSGIIHPAKQTTSICLS